MNSRKDFEGKSIQTNAKAVHDRIEAACHRAGRDPASITLIAVSKTRPVEDIEAAIAAGLVHFGENRVQEGIAKFEHVKGGPVKLHLIGHLQSNKAGKAVELFDLIHSIDSEALATEVNRRAEKIHKVQPILIQVNCSRETRKNGCDPGDLPALRRAVAALPNLDLRGFMTIGPLSDDPETARPAFRELARLRKESEEDLGQPLPELSMGMTADLEVAVEEGATLVRVGTALFGERRP